MTTSSSLNLGRQPTRRGVLLLVVLSMLTLFMMLGVAYVIMASRARESSRAFSRAMTQERVADRANEEFLEKSLMLLLRGPDPNAQLPANLTNSPLTFVQTFEPLLEDLYGSTERLEGRTAAAVVDHGVLCEVSIQNLVPMGSGTAPASPIELCGRIITFLPEKGRITSHRIRRAEEDANGYRIWLANHGDVFPRQATPAAGGGAAGAAAYDFPPQNTRVLINGRGHGGNPNGAAPVTNESWDGYDFATNSFLAWVEPDPARPAAGIVKRFSMFDLPSQPVTNNLDLDKDGLQDYCDNDGDGILDGQFFKAGFPPIPLDGKNVLQVDLSCLIVDLDGRLNLNAHGTLAALLYPEQNLGWPSGGQGGGGQGGGGSQWGKMPLGSGYGPAEINGRVIFDELMNSRDFAGSDDPWLSVFCGADPQGQYKCLRPPVDQFRPDPNCRTLPPGLTSLEGRYGGRARRDMIDPDFGMPSADYDQTFEALPGFEGINDPLSLFNELQYTGITRPIDLHGRIKQNATASNTGGAKPAGVVPTMQFAKPDQLLANPLEDDLTDDPYEINLVTAVAGGRNADPRTAGDRYFNPANGQTTLPDNRFSLGELERVLRPYDADSTTRAPRLFTLLGSQAEAARLLVTTESWSIPSITGEMADLLFGPESWFAKVANAQKLYSSTGPPASLTATTVPDGLVPVDLAAGLKLDLTPPLQTDAQRRSLFKDLFLTCVALFEQPGQNPSASKAEQYAQWAANVVEFQDADSTMTRYEYDPEPADGWDVDGDPATDDSGAIVWGGERPDVIITQTLAWTNSAQPNDGELYVMLHRPLKSTLTLMAGQPTAAEPIDPHLQGAEPDQIDLGRLQGDDPIWRLRLGSGQGATVVRFDPLPDPPGQNELGSQNPSQVVNEFAPHQWLCVRPSGASPEGVTVPASPDVESFLVNSAPLQVTPGTTEVRLERLADPSKPHEPDDTEAGYNPYIVVDVADIVLVDRISLPTNPNPAPHQVSTRSGWSRLFMPKPVTGNVPPEMTAEWSGNPEWLVWPDRPLVGITELLFVPGFAMDSYKPMPHDDPDAAGLFKNYLPPVQSSYLPDADLRFFEVVRVPSRFAGTRLSFATPADAAARASLESVGVYEAIRGSNQIDLAREPGLVNVNTIASDGVWKGVVQAGLGGVGQQPKIPGRTTTDFAATPAETIADILAVEGGNASRPPYEDVVGDIADVDKNPWHRLYTATRLANIATNRSHVFGIWLTVRTVEKVGGPNGPADLDTLKYSRMFVIYDRSKPVGYEPGRNHNVADGILLKRVLP
jgi:hypothetical protein